MRRAACLVGLLMSVSTFAQTGPAQAEKEDAICRQLWNEYVLHPNMVNRDEHVGGKFFAAVGLAEMGQPRGIDWLIEHADDQSGWLDQTQIAGAKVNSIKDCCRAALEQLTGQKLKKKAEWQTWWKHHLK